MLDSNLAEDILESPSIALIEEFNHRVINEYCEAIAALSIVAMDASPETRAVIASAEARLHAHAEAHRALSPPRAGGSVNLATHLGELFGRLSRASLADRNVRVILRSDEIRVRSGRAWRIGLVLAELVRNACRHGLARGGGSIAVRVSEVEGAILCLVADNGRARPKAAPGTGSRVVRSLIVSLGGRVDWFLSPHGSLVRLTLPGGESAPDGPPASSRDIGDT